MNALTAKRQLRVFLTRRLDTLAIPLAYKFGGEGRSLAITIPSAALAYG